MPDAPLVLALTGTDLYDDIAHDAEAQRSLELATRFILLQPVLPDTFPEHLRPKTRVIYVESLTNPLVSVADLRAVVRFARAHDLISVIDNTFASPVNFRPLDLGAGTVTPGSG